MKITVSNLSIPFKYSFSHAMAERGQSSSVLVEIRKGDHVGYGEGCPREYVTGETVHSAMQWIKRLQPSLAGINDVISLKEWVAAHEAEIDRHPSAWCAVETALLDLVGKETHQTLEALVGVEPGRTTPRITAVIGDGSLAFFEAMTKRCLEFGFLDFKIKLVGHLDVDLKKIEVLKALLDKSCSVRADFNNCFSSKDVDDFIGYFEALDFPFIGIEEPFEPFALSANRSVSALCNIPVILDESFTKIKDLDGIKQWSNFIPNIRISKLGGLLRTLRIIESAEPHVDQFILGSLVGETSLLARLWLVVAGRCQKQLLAGEGAYSTHLLETDITEFPIIVEPPGFIKVPAGIMGAPGLGIGIRPDISTYQTAICTIP